MWRAEEVLPQDEPGRRAAPSAGGEASPFDRLLLRTSRLTVGRFDAVPGQPGFHDSGPTANAIVVFPRTAVRIQQLGAADFVADPNVAVLYNRGQEYRRFAVDPRGDHSVWFALEPRALAAAVAMFDPRRDPLAPFAFAEAACDSRALLLERIVVRHLDCEAEPDHLLVEESFDRMLLGILAGAYRMLPGADELAPRRARREWIERARVALGERLDENLSLSDLADLCGVSPFHLCRAFRRETGRTVHRYRTLLRLRVALDQVLEGRESLTATALDAGFSGHSHFTEAFGREFGIVPSGLRGDPSKRQLLEARRRLDSALAPA